MQTTIPDVWLPTHATPSRPKWLRQLTAKRKPMVTLKDFHERPHPVGCTICGQPAGSFRLDDSKADYATCYGCASRVERPRFRFRDLQTGRPFKWPDEVRAQVIACLIAIAHLDTTP